MATDSDRLQLDALKARIRSVEAATKPETVAAVPTKTGVLAEMMRIGSDFVASIITAMAIGWGVDLWLGSAPWGLLVMLMLGFCAGLWRIARVLSHEQVQGSDPDGTDPTQQKERNDGDAFPH